MSVSKSKFSFGKNLRLLNAKEYQQVFDNVTWKASSSHFVFLSTKNSLAYPRLGLVIAKRQVRTAVQRNRIKRILREQFRLLQYDLANVDIIVLVRPRVDQQDNPQLQGEVANCFQRLNKKIQKSVS